MIHNTPHSPVRAARSMRWRAPLLLFTLILSCYLLTYSGVLTSADEISILASAESLLKGAGFATDQLVWANWAHGWEAQGAVGLDGRVYSKKGVGLPLLLWPALRLAAFFPHSLGKVHIAFLFNPLVCALTAVVLYAAARQWGYRWRVSFVLGALAGLGTLLWPYSKTLFREPFAGLCLSTTVYCVTGRLSTRRLLAAGFILALALSVRLSDAILLPLFLAYLSYRLWRAGDIRRLPGVAPAFLGPPALALAGVTWLNWRHFGSPFTAGYGGPEAFSTPLWRGLAGWFFSSDESLFLFAPLTLLALPGFVQLWRRRKPEAALLAGVVLTLTCLFAGWYDWRGGLAWGPRFAVPLMPIFTLMALPLFDDWLCARGGWRRGIILALGALSVLVQLSGVFVSYLQTASAWPIVRAWQLLGQVPLDSAWLAAAGRPLWPLIALYAGVASLALLLSIFSLRERTPHGFRLGAMSVGLPWLVLAGALWGLVRVYPDVRLAGGADFRALAMRLAQVASAGDVILNDNHTRTELFLNYDYSRARRYDLLRADVLRPEAEALLSELLTRHQHIWLITDRPAEAAIAKPEEAWLDARAFHAGEESFSAYARLLHYYLPSAASRGVNFLTVFDNGVTLARVELEEREVWLPGQMAALALEWRRAGDLTQPAAASVQLLRPDGTLAWQRDAWLTSRQVELRYGVPLPAEAAPSVYTLQVVVYDPRDGRRATILSLSSRRDETRLPIGQVAIR